MAAAWFQSGFELKVLASPSQICVATWLRPMLHFIFLSRGSVRC